MKVAPCCSADPVQIVPPFGFTAEQREQIVTALPLAHGKGLDLIAALERCARNYLWLRNQYRARRTQAEQNTWWPKSVILLVSWQGGSVASI